MEMIEKLFMYVEEELSDAKKYAKCAMQAKLAGDNERFSVATKLSEAELDHAGMWYDIMRSRIKDMRADHDTKGEKMHDYFEMRINEMADEFSEKTAKIRYMIEMNKR